MNFIATIIIERRPYFLTFSPVYTLHSFKLFVRAVNPEGEAVVFEMRKNTSNHWHVILPAPEWAIKYKQDLAALVKGDF